MFIVYHMDMCSSLLRAKCDFTLYMGASESVNAAVK